MSESKGTTRTGLAIAYHDMGYNCAQSVACAFTDRSGLDKETLFRVTEGLGRGMGGMEGTCGAISAACVLAGLKYSSAHTECPDSKAITYEASQACLQDFLSRNKSLVCRELRGEDTGNPLRSCPDCIRDAVRIIEEQLYAPE